MPLSELIDLLPKRYVIKDKITTNNGINILNLIKSHYSHDTIDETDGVKIFRENMWALVRTSGTEPIVRFIIDSDKKDKSILFHKELKDFIKKIVHE